MRLQKCTAIVLFILCFFLHKSSFAKNSLQDSIPTFDKEIFQASLKELSPKEFARLFTQEHEKDAVKAQSYIEYAKKSMITSKNLEAQFWGYFCLAKWERNKMNLKASITHLDVALTIAKSINNDDMIISSLMNKGIYYYDFGFYKEAMEYYLEVLKIAKQSDLKGRQLAVMQNIALLKIEVNDRKGAIELLEESLKIVENEKVRDFSFIHVNIYIALAKAYIGIEDYKQAAKYCYKGIELSEKYNDEGAKVYFYNFLGEIANANGNYEKAHEVLDRAEEIVERIGSTQAQLPFIKLDRAKTYYSQKKYEVTIQILLAIEKTQKLNSTDFIDLEEIYALLAKSYKEINNIEYSLKYYEKANKIYKENDKRQESISVDIIKKYDLRTLKEELDESQENSKRTKYILYIGVFLTVAMILSLIVFYRKRERNNQRKFEAILKSLEEEIVEKDLEVEKIIVKEVDQIKTIEVKETETKEIEIIDETKERLLKKLKSFEAKELYLSKHSSLNEVAKKLKTNTSYLSKLVNTHKGKSFTAYITDLRVNYAIKRLKNDKKFRSYTIDSIAQEIGFNRSESFSRAFKNKTGLYPSYFVKNLDSQNIE
ncbi:hypothetical protein IMCC3317_17350 [Kordia antarctica]|uniref:HTH araC/xylS-type domain-containing protein n=1 Tax=Kordia antarctica TaxID=1218801 RepID=A0A7L4ZI10_9FLAO|nr:tetratricopeptide repeat protein [Kordia antarctica]QHI36373.1 hypothetical protein IMCC3317_17350 [Kordia antarctica]